MFSEEDSLGIFRPIVQPWYDSLEDPHQTQQLLLRTLAKEYAKTEYGEAHGAAEVSNTEHFRASFPILNYARLSTYFKRVVEGNYTSILPEPVLCWVMTRGSTGPAKVLPTTRTHVEQILSCGARALINHAIRNKDFQILSGKILNLNFPSSVHTMTIQGKQVTYGYSSGTYARLNPALNEVSLLPRQEDIDTLGPGIGRQDWERRFELAYQQALGQNVTATMGVTPVVLSFARYVKRKHGKIPRDLWNFRAMFCTSVRKIQYKYAPVLRKYFGNAPVVEIYSATEGVFAQQVDGLPYVSPNYDAYFLEVATSKGFKMLHELERGEWGRLVISSCMFPRYDIGDLVESAGNNYFRVIGRNRALVRFEHQMYRLLFGWLI
jgi:phenylacetate-coenzyme A ligase PaaK-like adenylate-forming protein